MKNRLSFILAFALCCLMAVSFSSCNIGNTEMETERFTVYERDWTWNDVYQRYEYVFDVRKMTEDMYWHGSVSAGVYIVETAYDDNGRPYTYEVFRNLPFVHTYNDNGLFTQTIGFDLGAPNGRYPGTIAFYIQASDLSPTRKFLTDYSFKVTLFREE